MYILFSESIPTEEFFESFNFTFHFKKKKLF